MSNLNQYLSPRDPRFKTVGRFIKTLKTDIPRFSLSDIKVSEHPPVSTGETYVIQTHLSNEMEFIFNDENRYSVESKGKFWEKDFDNFYLKKLSTYRMVEEWMKHPIGLAAEVWVANKSFACPECGKHALVLSGGSSAAWADLHCSECKDVFIELKTKKEKAIRRIVREKKMTAGSYRWYKAQDNLGVKHYIYLLPKDGGNIYQFKIKSAIHAVDNKFCAYWRYATEYTTLRTALKLEDPKIIGKSSMGVMKLVENMGKGAVDYWMSVKFGTYAKKIQRAYKKYRLYK